MDVRARHGGAYSIAENGDTENQIFFLDIHTVFAVFLRHKGLHRHVKAAALSGDLVNKLLAVPCPQITRNNYPVGAAVPLNAAWRVLRHPSNDPFRVRRGERNVFFSGGGVYFCVVIMPVSDRPVLQICRQERDILKFAQMRIKIDIFPTVPVDLVVQRPNFHAEQFPVYCLKDFQLAGKAQVLPVVAVRFVSIFCHAVFPPAYCFCGAFRMFTNQLS